jgi:hypothetical protein
MSTRMTLLRLVLAIVVVVSLAVQVKAISEVTFEEAFGMWVDCVYDWWDCTSACGSPGSNPNYELCRSACNNQEWSCTSAIGWPMPQMDFCQNAQERANQCNSQYWSCGGPAAEIDCYTPYDECLSASGIHICQ